MPYKDIEKRRAYNVLWRQVHKEIKGMCYRCNREVFQGLSLCLYHLEETKKQQKKQYLWYREDMIRKTTERSNRLRQEGRCKTCGIQLIEGEGVYCVNCRIVQDYGAIKGVLREVN